MISRADALAALARERFDVVVVGGGITGAGVALDAASRGYSVALVERADYASGTSSRSSKLVHGGLRYLQRFDIGLVREALLERQINARLAPHLVTPLPLVVAAFEGRRVDRMTGVGLGLYDVLSLDAIRGGPWRRWRGRGGEEEDGGLAAWSPERHRTIDGAEVSRLLPALAPREPTSGYLFYDCQTDDSRLVLTVLGEAERFGAVCANGVEVTGLLEEGGRARGVRVRDADTDAAFEVRATSVVNATGVWADRLRPDELRDEAEVPTIRPSRGTHVTVAHEALPLVAGAIVPSGGGRFMFALPWLGRTLIGTTDVDHPRRDLDHVAPERADIDYILDGANAHFGTALRAADVTGAYAGVRPLIPKGDPKRSVDISRGAELYETSSGMLTITGGKLTTWRRMARTTVDRLVEREGRTAPCHTHAIPLGRPVAVADLPEVGGVGEAAREQLAARYGRQARRVLELAAEHPELAESVVDGAPADLLAEVVLAAREEQARDVADVLLRRTRLGLTAAREVTRPEVAGRVAAVLGGELGWDEVRVERERAAFLEVAAAEGLVPT